MCTWDDPEIAARYGALDSDAFTDGMSLHAHAERVLTRNANHLLAKREQIFALIVPRQGGDAPFTDDENHPYYLVWIDGIRAWVPTSTWTRITAPFPVAKKPGLHRAEARVKARVSGSHTVYLQIATRARPFNSAAVPTSPNVITLVGDGDDDVDSYTKSGLWIDPGAYEEIQIFAKALPTGDGADTAFGGEPNERADEPGEGFGYKEEYIQASATFATWTIPGWARTGAEIAFFDADANVIARRMITSVSEEAYGGSAIVSRRLHFYPPLSPSELRQVIAGDDWAVLQLPTLGLVGLTLAAEARTR